MAFNWDKLCKAQRDYPKPKFALDAIGKLLKKRPGDPYILAWKSTVLLQYERPAKEVISLLTGLCQHQPPITDLPLLSLIYKNTLEALRRDDPRRDDPRRDDPQQLVLPSVGVEGLKAWANATKILPAREAKLNVWSELFIVAMREECWEDVRFAIVQANKEGTHPNSKKAMYYSLILANQLAAEQRLMVSKTTGKVDTSSQIQFTLALRQIKEAYDNSPKPTDEAIRVCSMSDLRFMGAIYQRQNRCPELFQLWAHPPPVVETIMSNHQWDFELLKLQTLRGQEEWKLIETTCMQLVEKLLEGDDLEKVRQNLYDCCSISWKVWSTLFEATSHLYSESEGIKRIEILWTRLFEVLQPLRPETRRAIRLTHLAFLSYLNQPLLETMKEFYLANYLAPSCVEDLRRFFPQLPVEEQRQFEIFTREHARNLASADKTGAVTEISSWHMAEENSLSLELLILVSIPKQPDPEQPNPTLLEDFVANALRLWRIRLDTDGAKANNSSCLYVAISALVHLFKITAQPQYLYQATTLVRYAVSLDVDHQDRALALLSTRLHLMLGLGTVAFEHYSYAKIKEMLHDTSSWVLLSRISQSHPFGATGAKSFSADTELERVITAISRMEDRTDHLLYADMQVFSYDHALELLSLKRKLRFSLTKQFCIMERRRIARMKGVLVDRSLDLPLRDQENISDNSDWDVLPAMNFALEQPENRPALMAPITKHWLYKFRVFHDLAAGVVFKEIHTTRLVHTSKPYGTNLAEESEVLENGPFDHVASTEHTMNEKIWKPVEYILCSWYAATNSRNMPVHPKYVSVAHAFSIIHEQLTCDTKKLRADLNAVESTSLPYPSEDRLAFLYGRLEALRVLHHLVDTMRPVVTKRNHPFHKEFPLKTCTDFKNSIQALHDHITICVEYNLDRLRKSGVAEIKAHMLRGKTGEAIDALVRRRALDAFAKEYAESAVEAMKPILNVKLA